MKLNIKSILLLITAFSITEMSCLKDTAYNNGEIQSTHATGAVPKIVEIKLVASSSNNFYNFYVNNSPNDTVVDFIPVNLATAQPAPQDLHVTLTQNDQLVTDYNAANTDTTVTATNPNPTGQVTHFQIPTMYTVVNPIVIIPKGQHTGYMQIKFKPLDFVGTTKYAVGYSITKVDESGYTISGNTQNAILVIGIKNIYDGLYGLTIKTLGWGNYGISDGPEHTWPSNAIVTTSGANSVILSTKEAGTVCPAFDAAGGLTGFGATGIQFTFDPVTNLLTDVNNTVPPDSRNRAFHVNGSVPDSRYDPSSKTIFAAFIMTQNGRPAQQFYDTLVYAGSR